MGAQDAEYDAGSGDSGLGIADIRFFAHLEGSTDASARDSVEVKQPRTLKSSKRGEINCFKCVSLYSYFIHHCLVWAGKGRNNIVFLWTVHYCTHFSWP